VDDIVCHYCAKQLLLASSNADSNCDAIWKCLCGHLFHSHCKAKLEDDIVLNVLYCQGSLTLDKRKGGERFKKIFLEQIADSDDDSENTTDDDEERRDELRREIQKLRRQCIAARAEKNRNWQIIAKLKENLVNAKLLDLKLNIVQWMQNETIKAQSTHGCPPFDREAVAHQLQEIIRFYVRHCLSTNPKKSLNDSKMMANALSDFKKLCEAGNLRDSVQICEDLVKHFEYISKKSKLNIEASGPIVISMMDKLEDTSAGKHSTEKSAFGESMSSLRL